MINRILPDLSAERVVLASASPRRRQILDLIGLHPLIVASGFDEALLDRAAFPAPADFVQASAFLKAAHASIRCTNADLIITADTVVVHQGRILEKPKDDDDARQMLKSLSGRQHSVLTGVCMFSPQMTPADPIPDCLGPARHLLPDNFRPGAHRTWVSETLVEFASLSDSMIEAYLSTGEHRDKAGSYGIQGPAAMFAKRVDGCYFNVMGFPLQAFSSRLIQLKRHLS